MGWNRRSCRVPEPHSTIRGYALFLSSWTLNMRARIGALCHSLRKLDFVLSQMVLPKVVAENWQRTTSFRRVRLQLQTIGLTPEILNAVPNLCSWRSNRDWAGGILFGIFLECVRLPYLWLSIYKA